ncbi:hypothetical protein [Lysinibacillus contaminans]|uniref:hypothetical protein n=1 Tax=Lysinibacillus contaminans TaxID=1293441 RepID=UPI000A90F4AD|nr:hypothetical protein [Lysinibacillus contaminans]
MNKEKVNNKSIFRIVIAIIFLTGSVIYFIQGDPLLGFLNLAIGIIFGFNAMTGVKK